MQHKNRPLGFTILITAIAASGSVHLFQRSLHNHDQNGIAMFGMSGIVLSALGIILILVFAYRTFGQNG